jgi:histidinol-phosphatase (PHP family)
LQNIPTASSPNWHNSEFLFQNLHTHTCFSDGSDNPEKYAETAIRLGLASLGFSDHSPLPFENSFALRENRVQEYCDSILSLRKKYSGNSEVPGTNNDLAVFLGMETDFIPGMGHSFAYFKETFPLDYLIGSVHLVRNGSASDLWFIDGPDPVTYDDGVKLMFGGDIRKAVAAYYRQINEMLAAGNLDIIGHLDKIKMHNRGRFFSETDPWYIALVDETLDLVCQTGIIVEINTRGIYKKRSDSLFPGPGILKKIHSLKIPVIISSDAHKPAELSMLFRETSDLLRALGFSELMNLTSAGWETTPILT